jgi:hypothetical protein
MSLGSDRSTRPKTASRKSVKRSSVAVTRDDAEPAQLETSENVSPLAEAGKVPAHSHEGLRPAHADPRFHIFVIDTRWNSVASRVLRENLALIRDLNSDDPVYFLDRDASVALLREYSWQIGRDPIVCVHDLRSIRGGNAKRAHGFRMHLGRLRTEAHVLAALQLLARFIREHREKANIEGAVRQTLLLEGLSGAMQIMRAHPTARVAEEVLGVA